MKFVLHRKAIGPSNQYRNYQLGYHSVKNAGTCLCAHGTPYLGSTLICSIWFGINEKVAQLHLLFIAVLVTIFSSLVAMAPVTVVAVVFATFLSFVRSCLSQPQTAAPQDP